jgi:hypothetical protein
MDPAVQPGALWRLAQPPKELVYRCAQVFILAKSKWGDVISVVSLFTRPSQGAV